MRGIKIPQQDFALKMWGRGGGGLSARGAYLRDTTVCQVPARVLFATQNGVLSNASYDVNCIRSIDNLCCICLETRLAA